ncbi:50S ribosomal protein L24 [Wolbachia endosymbiont of Howardula sp.]|uniref:50S ribosomal protein L24 n=1 Tax=Wolbachia endosymbiont of Howardula sp. TaxID=2916816 RepID=UPI002202339A|nr:50S ribosomal protein L24 [Wolbachia endosymbiont of Howardula sp.]
MSAKIKRDDTVIVLTGKDKGKVGKIIKIITCNTNCKAIVSGINVYKRHTKMQSDHASGILSKELAIDISNLALLDPKYKTPTKVGFTMIDDKKMRIAKLSQELIKN